ncbi:hypothetical protein [Actinomadura vinacea]|uniref:hypothetical protein n=1 Tax=Actinomadura vinacea TaxID=115336 RepID=UPI0031DBDE74
MIGGFAGVAVTTGCGVSARADAEGPAGPPSASARTFDTFGDNGRLRVVKKSFAETGGRHGIRMLSYGLVIENRNTRAVAFPTFTVGFTDASGRPLETVASGRTPEPPRILPGDRQDVNGVVARTGPGKVTGIRVEFGRTRWITRNPGGRFTKLAAGRVVPPGPSPECGGAAQARRSTV